MSEKRVLLVDANGNPILTGPVQLDDTDKLAISLYGKVSAAGDTPILLGATEKYLGVDIQAINDGGIIEQYSRSDAQGNVINTLPVHNRPSLLNGTTWDRQRSNVEATLLASAARTAQTDSADQTNFNGAALILVIDVTADPATATITPEIQIKDSISGNYFTIWTAAVDIDAVGTYAYLFAPGGEAGSYTEAVNLRLARTWRFRMAVADADSITYSVSAVVLV